MNRQPPGFRPHRGDEDEEQYYPNPLGGVGHVADLRDAEDPDEEQDTPAWSFLHHIYVSIQVGPFVLVFGKPED